MNIKNVFVFIWTGMDIYRDGEIVGCEGDDEWMRWADARYDIEVWSKLQTWGVVSVSTATNVI